MHSLRTIQDDVDRWVRENGGYWPELANMARLSEEVGEVARALNHRVGPKRKKPTEADDDLAGELADVLWVVACLANQQGVDLDQAFARTMDKLRTRDRGRHT